MSGKAPIRISIGIVLNEGRVLLLQRAKKEGNLSWVFPGGKIEPGEESDAAVVREVHEETGVHCEAIRLLATKVHPDTGVEISYWRCDVIKGDAFNAEPDKATAVIWVSPKEAERLITSTISACVREELGLS